MTIDEIKTLIRQHTGQKITVKIANVTIHGDHQIEIRCSRTAILYWRGWDFEPDFAGEFKAALSQYTKY